MTATAFEPAVGVWVLYRGSQAEMHGWWQFAGMCRRVGRCASSFDPCNGAVLHRRDADTGRVQEMCHVRRESCVGA